MVYEEKVEKHAKQLANKIEAAALEGKAVEASEWFVWFAFDAMGSFGLSRSFDMLTADKNRYIIGLLRSAMRVLGRLSPVIWLARIGFQFFPMIPAVAAFQQMHLWCKNQLREREKVRPLRCASLCAFSCGTGRSSRSRHHVCHTRRVRPQQTSSGGAKSLGWRRARDDRGR